MDRASLWKDAGGRERAAKSDTEIRFLKSQLINLMLDWELEALALDARRYQTVAAEEREHLRDNALAYRKCIANLTELLNKSSVLACKSD